MSVPIAMRLVVALLTLFVGCWHRLLVPEPTPPPITVEIDHDAPVTHVEAVLLDSTAEFPGCGTIEWKAWLHFRITRVLGGPQVASAIVARLSCPDFFHQGQTLRLDLQPVVAHPSFYAVVDVPAADATVVPDDAPEPGASTATVDALVDVTLPDWPAGQIARVPMRVLRTLDGKLASSHISVMMRSPRTLRTHQFLRLTLAPHAHDTGSYVVVADAPHVREPALVGDPVVVDALLVDRVDLFEACGVRQVRAGLTFEVNRFISGAAAPNEVFTAVVSCPARLAGQRLHRLKLRRLVSGGDDYLVVD